MKTVKFSPYIFIGALALVILVVFNVSIFQKEQIRRHGETVLLELAPVDPRSLIQGDFMRLRYKIENEAAKMLKQDQHQRGFLVVKLDGNNVAQFVRLSENQILSETERHIRYHAKWGRSVRIVPDSFFFQEGHAKFYEAAKYGVFKFDGTQNSVLIGLADEARNLIAPD